VLKSRRAKVHDTEQTVEHVEYFQGRSRITERREPLDVAEEYDTKAVHLWWYDDAVAEVVCYLWWNHSVQEFAYQGPFSFKHIQKDLIHVVPTLR